MAVSRASGLAARPLRLNLESLSQVIKKYYYLTKPGIVQSNVMTAAAAYLFASRWIVSWRVFLGLVLGTALIIASACVLNNYLDRGLDSKMRRTKERALVTGEVSVKRAISYALVLGLLGFLILTLTNLVTILIGALAIFSYVVVYGLAKRRSAHGTLVGTLPGSASIVAGYTAFTGHLDLTAALLFLIMVTWQMAHFYAIAIYRLEDYKSASLPVWPAVKGVRSTRRLITFYICSFIAASLLLTISGASGYIFAALMASVGLYWLRLALTRTTDDAALARRLFLTSLLVLLVFAFSLPLSSLLP